MIPDRLDRHDPRQFVNRWFGRFARALSGRSKPGEPPVAVDQADVEVTEPHDMVSSLELRNADDLLAQRLADEDEVTMPLDLTGAADPAD